MKVLCVRSGSNRNYFIKAADNDPYAALAEEVIETAAANGRPFKYGTIDMRLISSYDVLYNAYLNLNLINNEVSGVVRRHAFKRLWEEASKIGQ